jgi:hypothetical protein
MPIFKFSEIEGALPSESQSKLATPKNVAPQGYTESTERLQLPGASAFEVPGQLRTDGGWSASTPDRGISVLSGSAIPADPTSLALQKRNRDPP